MLVPATLYRFIASTSPDKTLRLSYGRCRDIKEKAGQVLQPDRPFITRQRPTFPLPHSSSIIGLGGLNFRVRYGNGCGPSGNATGNLFRETLYAKGEMSYSIHVSLFTFHDAHCRARKTMSIRSKDGDVKPHDRLVLVSYSHHWPSTPSLSNS